MISLALDDQRVRLYCCVFDFDRIIEGRSRMGSLFHLLSLSQYITMAMIGLRLPLLHRWDDLVCPG